MIAHGKDIKVFAGNSNIPLAREICSQLFTKLGDSNVGQFADGECSISLYEPVRGKDVFVIQSTCNHVNDNLMELVTMLAFPGLLLMRDEETYLFISTTIWFTA